MEKVTNPSNPVVFFDVSIGNTVCKIQMSVVISTVFNIFYLSDVIIIVFIKRDAVRISLFYINKIRNMTKENVPLYRSLLVFLFYRKLEG